MKDDRELVKFTIEKECEYEKKTKNFQFASDKLKNNKEFVTEIVCIDPRNFQFVSD